MFRSYLKIAWRNLTKHKLYSLINMAGLAVGLTCCLLMAVYVHNELRFDAFQEKGDRIARVIMEYNFSGKSIKGNFTSTKVAPAFVRNFPEVETAVRMHGVEAIVRIGHQAVKEKRFVYADSTFFKTFHYRLLSGTASTALSGPNKLVLTQSTARKYFGAADPVGKTVKIGAAGVDYEITGVIEDYPANSQIAFDYLASFSSMGQNQEQTYWNANFTTYLLLRQPAAREQLQAKIPSFMKGEMPDLKGGDYVTFELEPFRDVHLYSDYDAFVPNSRITYVYIVGGTAFLMLLIACFTYINLSTARSLERAREVGVRKVVGAMRVQLFWQFISESLLLTLAGLVIALVLALLVLPGFNRLADRNLQLQDLLSPFTALFTLAVLLFISLLAGSYPALVLSRFQPIRVLKGSFKNTGSGIWLRRSLIVFQFVISVFLMLATFVMQRQLNYIRSSDVGFDREQVVVLPVDRKIWESLDTWKTELRASSDVAHIGVGQHATANIMGGYHMRSAEMPAGSVINVRATPVDEGYIPASGIHVLYGSNFTHQDFLDGQQENDSLNRHHFIVNESAARILGWKPEEAVGRRMFLGEERSGLVKAVVKDFHFASMREPIGPLVFFNGSWGNIMLVKLSGHNLPQALAFLETKWKKLAPHRPFEYRFLDEDFDKLYQSELRLGRLLNIFTGIAMLLACLGLFGLSSYALQQRSKEIGIRKVLGAGTADVVTLLSKDFVRLVLVSMCIALPVSGWLMHRWLQDFAYRTTLSWWIFGLTALAALAIAFLTVSMQALRTAYANPVKSLRTE